MPAVFAAAERLGASGQIVVTQRGRPVDLAMVKGPVRLGLATPTKTPGRN
jgi:hypothetical protein